MSTPAPIPMLGGVSVAWINQIAEIARRDGHALRAGAGPWIEVQSINTGAWLALTLDGKPSGVVAFASIADRDLVLGQIERLAARPAAPAAASFFTEAERTQARRRLDTLAALAAR